MFCIIVEDVDNNKFLHIDLELNFSWVDSKHDATPLDYNEDNIGLLFNNDVQGSGYVWHGCDDRGNFL